MFFYLGCEKLTCIATTVWMQLKLQILKQHSRSLGVFMLFRVFYFPDKSTNNHFFVVISVFGSKNLMSSVSSLTLFP